MPCWARPTIFSTVPYLVSPTAILGCNCQHKRTQQARSSIGVLSIIEAGVTKAARMIRALPPSTNVVGVIAQLGTITLKATHGAGIGIGGTDLAIRHPLVGGTPSTTPSSAIILFQQLGEPRLHLC